MSIENASYTIADREQDFSQAFTQAGIPDRAQAIECRRLIDQLNAALGKIDAAGLHKAAANLAAETFYIGD